MSPLERPGVDGIEEIERILRAWQRDGLPVQLHPGDLGWQLRFGTRATAAALVTWRVDGRACAVGLLDAPDLLRLAIAPEAREDEGLAAEIFATVDDPRGGLPPREEASIEVRLDGALRRRLSEAGWEPGEAWSPLSRDLSAPVENPGMRIEVAGPERVDDRVAVQRAAFDHSTFTAERWRAMAAGSPYADARCLVAYDAASVPVAAATVWSAGRGRPGLLEPVGVHRAHRGRRYGTAITLAAAATLRALGCSSALVSTPSTNVAAVATYRSAGFEARAEVRDLRRRRALSAARTAPGGRSPGDP